MNAPAIGVLGFSVSVGLAAGIVSGIILIMFKVPSFKIGLGMLSVLTSISGHL
jgi:ribose/xylose/arabinose/galactoside ABC-type transport system permease subunit